jgi:membrane protease YdiL (CAAX protease family)
VTNHKTDITAVRLRNLDHPAITGTIYLLSLVVLLLGLLRSTYPYGDARMVAGYLGTELQVLALFIIATVWLFPAARIGLQRPVFSNIRSLLPLAALLAIALINWIIGLCTLPATALIDASLSAGVLATTLVVGFTEEWMYRGLLFAALSRRFGLRNGAFIALVLFGVLHLLNMAAGMPPIGALFQFFMTMLIGSTLMLAAVGTRSLWIPVIVHGLYDFLTIETSRMIAAGSASWLALPVLVIGPVFGIYCLIRIARLEGSEPYPPAPNGSATP